MKLALHEISYKQCKKNDFIKKVPQCHLSVTNPKVSFKGQTFNDTIFYERDRDKAKITH